MLDNHQTHVEDGKEPSPISHSLKLWIPVLFVLGFIAGSAFAFTVFWQQEESAEPEMATEPNESAEDSEEQQSQTKERGTPNSTLGLDEVWAVYGSVNTAIDNKDLERLESLTYRDQSECFDNFEEDRCWEILGANNDELKFSRSKMVNMWEGDKQAILSSDTEETEYGNYIVKQLFFIRDQEGNILYLGQRVASKPEDENLTDSDNDGRFDEEEDCTANKYSASPDSCMETDTEERDTDGDGWWDGVEIIATTDPNDPQDQPLILDTDSADQER